MEKMTIDEVLIIHPQTLEKMKALKTFLSAFNLEYKVEKSYNTDFVRKIQKSRQEFVAGKFIRVEKEDLKSFLGV